MRRLSVLFLALFVLLACTNDGASYTTDHGRQIVTVIRENNFFWDKRAQFFVVIARTPDCQRRHALRIANLKTHVELWQPGENTFILRIGMNMYVVENRTCEGFAPMEAEPPGGLGRHLGTFGESKGVFIFAPQEAAAEEPPAGGTQ